MENQEKKITLDSICEELNKRTSEAAKTSYISAVVKIKSHVSYITRDVVAKNIIDTAHFTYPSGVNINTLTEEELKTLKIVPSINRSAQYVMSALMLVDLYTNIQLDFARGAFQYDKLVETGIINYVLNNVPEAEINEFKMLIDYKYDEYYQKYFSIRSYVDSKLDNVESTLSTLIEMFTTAIANLDKQTVKNVMDKLKDVKNK